VSLRIVAGTGDERLACGPIQRNGEKARQWTYTFEQTQIGRGEEMTG
jgi:hypothetical protein